MAYHKSKNYTQAITDYSICILIKKEVHFYRNRSISYWEFGLKENSVVDLYEARKISKDSDIDRLLGLRLLALGRRDEAFKLFDECIKDSPNFYEGYLARGNVLFVMEEYRKARQDYCKALILNPQSLEAYVNIAATFQKNENFTKSLEILNCALEVSSYKCSFAFENRAMVYIAFGEYGKALVDISRAIILDPDNSEYYSNRGAIYQCIKEKTRAFHDFKTAVSLNSNNFIAYFNLGNIFIEQGNWEFAKDSFDKSISICPDIRTFMNRGIIHMMLKNYKDAVQDFSNALEYQNEFLDKYKSLILQNRARALLLLEKK
jgi:tetratricopeptide (TPR) repeat protein